MPVRASRPLTRRPQRTDVRTMVRSAAWLAVALSLGLAVLPAGAGGSPKGHGDKAGPNAVDLTVKMPRLVAPVMVKGEMTRYLHIDVTLKLPDDKDRKTLSDKVPYLQDAFLRDVHAVTILKNEDTQEVDKAGLKARLLAICERVAGAGLVNDIELRDVSKPTE